MRLQQRIPCKLNRYGPAVSPVVLAQRRAHVALRVECWGNPDVVTGPWSIRKGAGLLKPQNPKRSSTGPAQQFITSPDDLGPLNYVAEAFSNFWLHWAGVITDAWHDMLIAWADFFSGLQGLVAGPMQQQQQQATTSSSSSIKASAAAASVQQGQRMQGGSLQAQAMASSNGKAASTGTARMQETRGGSFQGGKASSVAVMAQEAQWSASHTEAFGWDPVRCLLVAAALLAVVVLPMWWRQMMYETARREEALELMEANALALTRQKQRFRAALASSTPTAADMTAAQSMDGGATAPDSPGRLQPAVRTRQQRAWGGSSTTSMDDDTAKQWKQFMASSKASQVEDVWDMKTAVDYSPQATIAELEEMTRRFRDANKNTDGSEKAPVTFDELYGAPLEIRRRKAPPAAPTPSESSLDDDPPLNATTPDAGFGADGGQQLARDRSPAHRSFSIGAGADEPPASRVQRFGGMDTDGEPGGGGGLPVRAKLQPLAAAAESPAVIKAGPPPEETMVERAARRRARLASEFMSDEEVNAMLGGQRAGPPVSRPRPAPAPPAPQQQPPAAAAPRRGRLSSPSAAPSAQPAGPNGRMGASPAPAAARGRAAPAFPQPAPLVARRSPQRPLSSPAPDRRAAAGRAGGMAASHPALASDMPELWPGQGRSSSPLSALSHTVSSPQGEDRQEAQRPLEAQPQVPLHADVQEDEASSAMAERGRQRARVTLAAAQEADSTLVLAQLPPLQQASPTRTPAQQPSAPAQSPDSFDVEQFDTDQHPDQQPDMTQQPAEASFYSSSSSNGGGNSGVGLQSERAAATVGAEQAASRRSVSPPSHGPEAQKLQRFMRRPVKGREE